MIEVVPRVAELRAVRSVKSAVMAFRFVDDAMVVKSVVPVAFWNKRFVVEARFAKKLVVVALVVVELTTERLVMDEEAFTIIPTVEVGVMAERPEKFQLEKLLPVVERQVPPTA